MLHDATAIKARAEQLAASTRVEIYRRTDRMFAVLLIVQWLAMIGLSIWVTPLAWAGATSSIHPHIWAAVVLGGLIIGFPLYLIVRRETGDRAGGIAARRWGSAPRRRGWRW